MAHVCLARDHLPVAAPPIKAFAHLDVEVVAHGFIIAKLGAEGKQHFAPRPQQSSAMQPKSLNQVLAETLNRVMLERDLNNKLLGKMAGVAPNTISNYRKATGEAMSASGKDRSANFA